MVIQRSGAGGRLSAAVERLSQHAGDWSAQRLLDEGLDLVRDSTWAEISMLHSVGPDGIRVVARRPDPGVSGSRVPGADIPSTLPVEWFPWGLAPVNPRRFLLVEDATSLPVGPGRAPTVAALGMRSCLHLPILERQSPVGALHLYWSEPRLAWDDDHGRLLRTLGRFLLTTTAATASPAAPDHGP
jgi:GAF domain-containing protein